MADALAALESRVPPAAGSPDGDDRRAREVADIVDQLAEDFRERDALYAKIEKILHGEHEIAVPVGFKQIAVPTRSPLPMHMKNTIAAALSVNYPEHQVKPLGFGSSWEENATQREHFADASFRRQEREAGRPVFRLFMDALVAKGEGVLKTVERTKKAWFGYPSLSKKVLDELDGPEWRAKSYQDRRKRYDEKTEDYKKLQPFPITTTDVLPETFKYVRGEEGFTFCSEVKEVPYYDTLARFGHALDRDGAVVPEALGLPVNDWHRVMDKTRTLTMVEAWTWKSCTYVLLGPGQASSQAGKLGTGTVVRSFDHAYGDPHTKTLRGPYFQAQGILSHVRMPHRAGIGVLTPFLDLFVLLDNYLTYRQVSAHKTAYATYKRNRPAEAGLDPGAFGLDGTEVNGKRRPLVLAPNTVVDDDIGPVEQPRSGADFNTAIDEIRSFLELALPSVLHGAVDTTESGWQLSQAVHLARLAWDPIVSNAERALSNRAGFESRLIARIGERVYAWGEASDKTGKRSKGGYLSISPEDLGDAHDVYEVKLSPELPSTEVVKLRYWGEAVERGFASKADAISDLGRNPDEVERQIRLEKFKESPEVEQRITRRVLELLGDAEQEALTGAAPGMAPPPDAGAALMGMGNPMVPGQNLPVEPVPPGAGAPIPSAGQLPPGNPPGMEPGIPSERLVMP